MQSHRSRSPTSDQRRRTQQRRFGDLMPRSHRSRRSCGQRHDHPRWRAGSRRSGCRRCHGAHGSVARDTRRHQGSSTHRRSAHHLRQSQSRRPRARHRCRHRGANPCGWWHRDRQDQHPRVFHRRQHREPTLRRHRQPFCGGSHLRGLVGRVRRGGQHRDGPVGDGLGPWRQPPHTRLVLRRGWLPRHAGSSSPRGTRRHPNLLFRPGPNGSHRRRHRAPSFGHRRPHPPRPHGVPPRHRSAGPPRPGQRR